MCELSVSVGVRAPKSNIGEGGCELFSESTGASVATTAEEGVGAEAVAGAEAGVVEEQGAPGTCARGAALGMAEMRGGIGGEAEVGAGPVGETVVTADPVYSEQGGAENQPNCASPVPSC